MYYVGNQAASYDLPDLWESSTQVKCLCINSFRV